MMLKLLVGLSVVTTAIFGKVITSQNNVDPRTQTNCDNSEVLLKIWAILSSLLGPDGKSVKVPDAVQLKYSLTLIKKSLEEQSTAQNSELSQKLKLLETELAHNKATILNDQNPLRTLLDSDPIRNDLSSNILFRYDLPSNIKPSCKNAFLNLIDIAQEAYVNMAKSPVCNNINADSIVPNSGGPAYYEPTGQLHQKPYNPAFISNVPISSEVALKRITEYLQAPGNYNANNVMSLLQSLQPRAPYLYNPLNYGLNRFPQPQLTFGQTPGADKTSDVNSSDDNNAANPNSLLHGDLNTNLEHAKEVADKVNAQNNMYANDIPDTTETNLVQANFQTTPRVDIYPYPVSGGIVNSPPNQQISYGGLNYIPVKNGNYANPQNVFSSTQYLYKPPQYGSNFFNPYQNQEHLVDDKNKIKPIQETPNLGDNINHNKLYQPGINIPGGFNDNIYQNALPYQQSPISNPFAVNSNNNLAPDNQVTNDFSGVANSAKLDTKIKPKGEVELTYLLKRKRPLIYQPFYFVKYRLPYDYFVQNLRHMLSIEADLMTPPTELYKGLIAPSNATEVSPDLATYPKEEIHSLVLKDGALVKATYIQPNRTEYNDTTVDSESDPSEVKFADTNIVEQDGIRTNAANGLSSNQIQINNRLGLNPVGQNPLYLVGNQGPTGHEIVKQVELGQQSSPFETQIPLQQKNQQNLKNLLLALGLENPLHNELNHGNLFKVDKQAPVHEELSQHNVHQDIPNILNQPAINQENSPYSIRNQAAINRVNLPYFDNSQALLGQRVLHYNVGNQDVSQKWPPFVQNHGLFRQGTQHTVGIRKKAAFGPVWPPYILGTEADSGQRNNLEENNVINKALPTLGQSRRFINGYGLDPNQYGQYVGNSRPGLYPNGLVRPYSGLLGNQSPLGQVRYPVNNVLAGSPQRNWYQNQLPMYG